MKQEDIDQIKKDMEYIPDIIKAIEDGPMEGLGWHGSIATICTMLELYRARQPELTNEIERLSKESFKIIGEKEELPKD